MKLTRILKSFQIGLNREKLMYSFIYANNSGKAEINLIRKNLNPSVGNCDHDVICHILQHYIKNSSPFSISHLIHLYQRESNISSPFITDFLLLNKDDRYIVIEAAKQRNIVRKLDINLNKFNLSDVRHQKVLDDCEIQLQELEKLK
tara:strand:+ start:127 stop:567 length:441 start_codon:yes stop_codon:yes gene_type:complete